MLDFTDPANPVPYGDNIAGLVFSEEQGSFLVGAAAALKCTTGQIGFIGGVKGVGGLIEKFEAGYIAGAKAVNPDIEVVSNYITEAPDFDGFNAPDRAHDIATAMYDGGADIVYHAAGGSGAGLFEAAKASSDAIGHQGLGDRCRQRPVQHLRCRGEGLHPHVDDQACRRRRVRDHQGPDGRQRHRVARPATTSRSTVSVTPPRVASSTTSPTSSRRSRPRSSAARSSCRPSR